ncbi:lipid A-modifier LpxR family protein [Shimia aestuarii]|uniref:lipid A-modifier LpxR family protein n=1 Tax=Shimia aestuarii TaxID=254406 RepID=UPI001FB3D4ED|nr:lipid A-modifier LpxR family protein [Shimia aestuarii]
MIGRIAALFLLMTATATQTMAQDAPSKGRSALGYGLLFVNDLLGDGRDRWRTGSVMSSRVYGPAWTGALPGRAGEVLELRFLGEVMAPDNLVTPAPGDRPFAGSLSLGLHTHFATAHGTEVSLGGDVVAIGPQTSLDNLQTTLHDVFGMNAASAATLNAQIGDKIRPTATLEMARDVALSEETQFRPFMELRGGVETYARVGFDVTIGRAGQGELLTRDPVTGHRMRVVRQHTPGLSWIVGADVAKVWDSVYLPEDRGYALTNTRTRARLGLHWQGEKSMVFYGMTYLGEEFVGQGSGQFVGALQFSLKF